MQNKNSLNNLSNNDLLIVDKDNCPYIQNYLSECVYLLSQNHSNIFPGGKYPSVFDLEKYLYHPKGDVALVLGFEDRVEACAFFVDIKEGVNIDYLEAKEGINSRLGGESICKYIESKSKLENKERIVVHSSDSAFHTQLFSQLGFSEGGLYTFCDKTLTLFNHELKPSANRSVYELVEVRKDYFLQIENILNQKSLSFATGESPGEHYLNLFLKENNPFDDAIFLAAKKEDEILGVVIGESIIADTAILWYISTIKQYEGNGVGGFLIDNFEKKCLSMGLDRIMLHIVPSESNKKFYINHGYDTNGPVLRLYEKILD